MRKRHTEIVVLVRMWARAPTDSDQKVTCRIPSAPSPEAAASAFSSRERDKEGSAISEKKIRFHESPRSLFIFQLRPIFVRNTERYRGERTDPGRAGLIRPVNGNPKALWTDLRSALSISRKRSQFVSQHWIRRFRAARNGEERKQKDGERTTSVPRGEKFLARSSAAPLLEPAATGGPRCRVRVTLFRS